MVSWLRRLRAAIIRRTILPGLGYKVRETANGYSLEILPSAGRPGEGIKFKIYQVEGNVYAVGPGNVITTGNEFEPVGIGQGFVIDPETPGKHWFYLAIGATSASVQRSHNPPDWSVNAVPIGYVSTLTTPFVVYQHQRDHLTIPCA